MTTKSHATRMGIQDSKNMRAKDHILKWIAAVDNGRCEVWATDQRSRFEMLSGDIANGVYALAALCFVVVEVPGRPTVNNAANG